jgi:hypothetical protein
MKETEQNEGDEVESEMGKGKGRGGGDMKRSQRTFRVFMPFKNFFELRSVCEFG